MALFPDSTVCGAEIPAAVVLPISMASADGLFSGSPGISLLCRSSGNLLIPRGAVSRIC